MMTSQYAWVARNIALAFVGYLALAGPVAGAMPPSEPVLGPMLLCFKYSTFQLGDGERVTDFSASPESMSLKIEGPAGAFDIGESEIWAEPKRRGQAMLKRDGTSVYWDKRRGRYGIYGPTSYSPDETQLVIWLSGDALRGSTADRSIYSRFDVGDPEGAACGYGFTYGWFFDE